jgi:TonB family protein
VPTPARDEPPPPVWAGGEPLRTPAPRFPQRALYGGIEGWVQVAFDVGADGEVDDVEIVEAYPKGVFERAATRAVARWEFEPYTLDGVPTARRVAHTIDFLLEDGAMLAEADGCRTVTGSRICLGQRLGIEDLERGLVMQRADAR